MRAQRFAGGPVAALAAAVVLAGTILAGAAPLRAEPTEIVVRVLSRDAKFIGTSMGGALITLRDADTGALLAEGTTRGGTGDTRRIVVEPRKRGTPLSGEGAALFRATLDLDRPTRIEATAMGPLAQRQAANRVSAVQWVVPGKHLSGGDGWVLEMPGFVVDVLAPPAHVKLSGAPKAVEIRANVTMMCGCPIEPGGLWDARRYEVKALLSRNGAPAGESELTYAGSTSQFSGALKVDGPGVYEAVVYAYDARTGNTGLDSVTFGVTP